MYQNNLYSFKVYEFIEQISSETAFFKKKKKNKGEEIY